MKEFSAMCTIEVQIDFWAIATVERSNNRTRAASIVVTFTPAPVPWHVDQSTPTTVGIFKNWTTLH